jgi:hypothetical protein
MRWLDDVESYLKKIELKGWKEKTRDREQWRLVVEEVKAHKGLWGRLAGIYTKSIFLPWRLRHQVPTVRWWLSTILYVVASQENVILISTVSKISNLTSIEIFWFLFFVGYLTKLPAARVQPPKSRIMNELERYGRKHMWPNSGYYHSICLEGPRKITTNLILKNVRVYFCMIASIFAIGNFLQTNSYD